MPKGQGFLDEGLRAERNGSLDDALAAYGAAIAASVDPRVHAEAYTRIADVHRERCQWEEGVAAAQTAQRIAREAALERELADARIAEGNVLMIQGEFAAAMPIFREVADSSVDPRIRGIALQNLGSMFAQLGQHGAAERAFAESLGNFQKAGYWRGQVISLNNLGRLAIDRGALAEAQPLLERAVSDASQIEDAELAALASQNLATVLAQRHERDRALDLAMSALGYFSSCRNHFREIESLRLIAAIHEQDGDVDSARQCYQRALHLAEKIESDVEIRVTRHRLDRLAGPK